MKFFFRCLLILVPLVIISLILNIRDFKNNHGKLNKHIYQAITIATKQNQYTKVIIGDSVAHSLFSADHQNETDTICYLATNQAISCAGQYLLVHEYLQHNPQTQKVILMYRPQSFQQKLISPYLYQYFIMPFYNKKFINYIELSDRKKISALFKSFFLKSNALKFFFDYMPFFAGKFMATIALDNIEEVLFSQTSEMYLKKIIDLCAFHNITFEIIPSPISDTDENKNMITTQKEKIKQDFYPYFNSYYSKLLFFPEASFFDDIHFTDSFIRNNRDDIITQLLGNE